MHTYLSVDSAYDQGERYLAYGTGIYLMVIVWIIYLQIYWPANMSPAKSSSSDLNNTTLVFSNTISKFLPTDFLTFAALSSVSFAVGYFFKYLGIHELFDKFAFNFNREIVGIIYDRLRSYFYTKFPDRAVCSLPKKPEFMKVFYEFIDKQQDSWIILRALSFSFWLKYRLSMNLIVFSIIGILFKFLVDVTHPRNDLDDWIYYPYAFFAIVGFFAYIISQYKVRPEIKKVITEAQLDKMIYDSNEELDKILKARFRA